MNGGEGFVNSQQYARRLGENYVTFRQAVAHKRGTLGSRGGAGYAPPGVKKLAERIAPPTTYAGTGSARPLWSVEDIERFEAGRGEEGRRPEAPGPGGRVRRPAGLEGVSDEDLARVLADTSAALTDREREILRTRVGLGGGLPLSLDEVGAGLGLTRERVRQIERRACEKVREALGGSVGTAAR